MSCSPTDLKDYFLGELDQAGRRQLQQHLEACGACREELERLRLTQAALLSLREEEAPRRIAFVSDKVFEPRWWRRLWQSGPRLGFASALLLSIAVLAHALLRPAAPAPPPVDTAALERRISEEVARRLKPDIAQAVAEAEARQAARIDKARQELEFQRRADLLAFQESLEVLNKRMNVRYMASLDSGGLR